MKRDLVRKCSGDIDAYMDGKDPFIKSIEMEALHWYSRRAQQVAVHDVF